MIAFLKKKILGHKKFVLTGLVVLVFILGLFLRFYRLNEIPVSLYWDGVADGYNAYSVLLTGKDEYGTFMPLLFRSFNDYKMPGNIYLMTIPIALFGLNEFSVRFTSAFFGSLTVLLSYFLVKEFFALGNKEKKKEKSFFSQTAAIGITLLTTFFFAISPWHLQFSHSEFEAPVGLFFVVLGVLFFTKFINTNKLYAIILSMLGFGISMYMYRSIDLFVPLLLVGLFFIFRKELLVSKKYLIVGAIVFFAILSPFIPVMFSKGGVSRINDVGIPTNSFNEVYHAILLQEKFHNALWAKVVFNRRAVYSYIFVKNYFSHFTPYFLILKGDINARHGPRDMGELYYWELPAMILGLFALWKVNKKMRGIVLLWFFLAPIPAATSVPAPHALRSLNILPMPELLSALGVWYTYTLLKNKTVQRIYIGIFSVVFVVCFGYYLYLYYGPSARVSSRDYGDGYKQLIEYVIPREKNYDTIVISGHYWQPYIYAIFYKKYDPRLYQKSGSKLGFDKYKFGGTIWEKGQYELDSVNLRKWAGGKRILVALSPLDPFEYQKQKKNIRELTRIYNHNGELVFVVGEVK